MRKMSFSQILMFSGLFCIILLLSGASTVLLDRAAPLGAFREVILVAVAFFFLYAYAIAIYRLFHWFFPLKEGYLEKGSREEFAAQVGVLFYLVFFNFFVRTNFTPVPLMRLIYLLLGAKIGPNSYSAGAILDPSLTRIGRDSLIGHNSVLFCHAIEGDHFSLDSIEIGSHVTVGSMAVIMPGVKIEDHAIISSGAVVKKGSVVGSGEIWGGVPARRIGLAKDLTGS